MATEVRLAELPVAVQNNLAWRAARHRIEEARGRLIGAGRLSNPSLEFEGDHDTAFREGSFSVAFSQAFPVNARLKLEKAVSAKQLAAAEAELRDELRGLLYSARSTAIDYLAIRRQKQLQEEQKALAEKLVEFIASTVAVGELSSLDENQARLETARADLRIRQLEVEAKAVLARLRPLLGIDPNTGLTLTGELKDPTPVATGAGLNETTNRPDFHAAELAIEAAEREIALEQAKRREDISVGIFAEGER